MNLTAKATASRKQGRDLPLAGRAELSCRLAKQLEKAGEYEAAYDALSEFWPDRQQKPTLEGLDEAKRAQVLLRVGALAGWLGSADQSDSSQETAKNILTQSREILHELGDAGKEAEVHGELGLCYWREGSYDEARVQLRAALHLLPEGNEGLRAILLIRAGMVEVGERRLNEALRLYDEAKPLLERSEDHALKGAFHNESARLFRWFGQPENVDRALIEYAAASYHFEQAGNVRYLARVENNIGFLYFTLGRYDDAHQHLDRARHIFLQLKDIGTVAQVDETRARTLLAQGRLVEAERIVRLAVKTLERGGQQAVLAEALTTHGTTMARMGNYARARVLLQRAHKIAETAGDLEGAGRAHLTIIEELSGQTPAKELITAYRSAIDLLRQTEDPSSRKRLISCVEKVLGAFDDPDAYQQSQVTSWEGFSFKQQIHNYERALLEQALRDAGGSVTRAARLLGFSHHHSLISLLNTRHQELLKSRSAARKRRQPLISAPGKTKTANGPVYSNPEKADVSQLVVLHVEDHKVVAELIRDTLVEQEMRVVSCAEGLAALDLLKSDTHYDVIIVGNDLPGLSGLELVLRARSLSHRRYTPIIMLSGHNCEKEAWRAGVDAFLLKPKGVDKLPSTVDRLLEERRKKRRRVTNVRK